MGKGKINHHTAHELQKKLDAQRNIGGGKEGKKDRLNPGKLIKCSKLELGERGGAELIVLRNAHTFSYAWAPIVL